MGRVRALLAHDFRPAFRAGRDVRGGAGQSRVAGMENIRADSRGDDLRANLRDGV